ncbi:MAG: DUF58 domain-containing protein [Flavobacteriales bacterium]|jgi:uncharacterized protein (DUF58 family)|nr:DUF58 domain-containing protein [Flavobacteriales bacterium]
MFWKHFFLHSRFFIAFAVGIISLVFGHFYPSLTYIVYGYWLVFILLVFVDSILLFAKRNLFVERNTADRFSNGDQNPIWLTVENHYSFPIHLKIIDEIPFQFQKRDFKILAHIEKGEKKTLKYELRPISRGLYHFKNINVFTKSPLGLVARKYIFECPKKVPVFPSFLKLRDFLTLLSESNLKKHGAKKIRRLGHTMEFEQIKEYTLGDDIRTINWKATAKRDHLMINQYQDERSQQVYMLIDKGRLMQNSFEDLSLLDHAINTCLVLSHIILRKDDKLGLFTFRNRIENQILADNKIGQLNKLQEQLYRIETNYKEADFGLLYRELRNKVKQRSLLFLFTNFEVENDLNRKLPYLKAIAKNHQLVVIFFKNDDIQKEAQIEPKTVYETYSKASSQAYQLQKELMVKKLHKQGIITIYTHPRNITTKTINQYLKLKQQSF